MTMLLLVVVLVIYMNVTGGPQGTEQATVRSAKRMSDSIRGMSP